MKLKSFLSVIFSAAMMLHAPYCIGQSNTVFYGASSNSIGVSFIDTNLSPTEWSGMPVLWHGGKWVFCMWEDGMP
jgi:hypothetical protein